MTKVNMTTTAKYNKSDIFKYTWRMYKAQNIRTMEMFSTILKNAWHIAKTNPMALKQQINIDKCFRLYSKDILSYATNKLNNYDMAQDILSATFEKAILNKDKFDISKGTEKNWLIRIATNCILDLYRHNKNWQTTRISDYTDENGKEYFQIKSDNYTDKELNNNDLSYDISIAFDKLNDKYKEIATLSLIEGKEIKEIANILDIPIGTVCVSIKRIREQLQTNLQIA